MKKAIFFILTISLVSLLSCNKKAEPSKQIEIKDNWEFRQLGKKDWLKAAVPGTVHQDLLNHKLIPDPFVGLNEFDVQWIENEDWEYKTTFNVPEEISKQENVELFFKGLDTYADVYLNDSLILSADNMFRSWETACKDKLKQGNNELRIVFKSPVKIGMEKLNKLGFLIPAQNEQAPKGKQTGTLTRKAAYHFGWDWGPRLVTSGIWQPIYLRAWSAAKINDVFLAQKNLTADKADYTSNIEVIATKDMSANIKISADGKILKEEKVNLKKGNNDLKIDIAIDKPELWWSAGLGNPKLYQIKTSLIIDGIETQIKESKLGVRTLKVIQKPDSVGKSFYVELNGVPVFMKGADYIPGDNLIPRVDSAKYRRVIDEALAANMNILRVWGGAIYEKDYFYDLCAEKGIVLYHDFMFACSMYPADNQTAENIRLEAEEQVKRLRNYPNIMLWAGNNEILNGWHEWNFQQRFGYNDQQKDTLWKYYTRIFYEILPAAVKKYDPEKLYWACSPQSDQDKLQNPLSGDQHFWEIWFGSKPFSAFERQPGRFISEYGFQSYPCMNTLRKIAKPEDLKLGSEVLNKRQRSPMESLGKGKNGNDMIDWYLRKEFKGPKDFESYVYVTQLLHAQAIKTAANAHRRNMPYTMGSMYWQINDCWPTISWATVDFYGNWKAPHYQARDSYKEILVSATQKENNLKVYVVSDRLKKATAEIRINVYDFKGTNLYTKTKSIEIPGDSSSVFIDEKIADLLKGNRKEDSYVHVELYEGEKLLSEDRFYFVIMKSLNLPKPKVDVKITKDKDQYTLEVSNDKFAKNVYISFEDFDANLSDNFFDMNANSKKVLTFKSGVDISIDDLNKKLKVLTLADTY
jgi:beta-mannosidase